MDTEATIEQSIRMVESGCEIVRITAPSIKDAENLANIKKGLRERGFDVPLVADIHFTPNAAEAAARIVEKVRVNPGNYIDRKKFQTIEYTDDAYQQELDILRERFTPLVKICKEEGTAMRIGTNHGSLSDRIMSRFGDTPMGMVESALEFVRIAQDNDYHDIILSMKASNPLVMVEAYRLLVHQMMEAGMNYPLHIGVTEAGEGEDGRIKSAVGIGTLLEDGLGDTVRVSLTEDPEFESPVARKLVERYSNRSPHQPIEAVQETFDPFNYNRRESGDIDRVGGDHVPVVIADMANAEPDLGAIGYTVGVGTDKWSIADMAADYLYVGSAIPTTELPEQLGVIIDAAHWQEGMTAFPLINAWDYDGNQKYSDTINFIDCTIHDLTDEWLAIVRNDLSATLILSTQNRHAMAELRRAFLKLKEHGVSNPVIVRRNYPDTDEEQFQLYAATDIGGLLVDGMGDGIWMDHNHAPELENRTCFNILQATRTRISKTEYISCPSCGRTLFDLQETTARISARTSHLKGVKISIMGCIVNGPGEMADADYGYVGSGPDKITLYRGKEVVKKNLPTEAALDELIGLIDEDGRWIDPT
jgi:(E)-4-hydroxy-3-methylbut-2-enyl-diphosphate synthase